jgi:glycerophosphoryl diester phosphodiesterase
MKCIAHRGYSIDRIDNSIDAIQEAVHRSYDGIEIDVQLCASGEIVLFHDVYVGEQFISDLCLNELKQLGICSLEDVYREIPEIKDVFILLDIKGNNIQIVKALVDFYKDKPSHNVTFCSFNRKILYAFPDMFQRGSTFETTFTENEYEMITTGLKVVVLHWTCLDHNFISYCKSKDIKVYTYTHKEDKEIEYMYRYGVDGIITNGLS